MDNGLYIGQGNGLHNGTLKGDAHGLYDQPFARIKQVEFLNAGAGENGGGGANSQVLNIPYPAVIIPGSLLLMVCTDRTTNTFTANTTSKRDWTSAFRSVGINNTLQIFSKVAFGDEVGLISNVFMTSNSNVKLVRVHQFLNASSEIPYINPFPIPGQNNILFNAESYGSSSDPTTVSQTILKSDKKLSLAVSFIHSNLQVAINTYAGGTGGVWTLPMPTNYYTSPLGNGSAVGMNIAPMPNVGVIKDFTQSVVNNLQISFVLNPIIL